MKDVEIVAKLLEAPWLTPTELAPDMRPDERTRMMRRLRAADMIRYAEGRGGEIPVIQPTDWGRECVQLSQAIAHVQSAPPPKPKAAKPKAATPKPDSEKDHITQAFYAVYCDYFKHRTQANPKAPTAADLKAAKEMAQAIQNVRWLWETTRQDGNAQFWAYYHKLKEQAVFRWSTELSLPVINKEWNTIIDLIKRLHNGEYVGTLTAKEQSKLRNSQQLQDSARARITDAVAGNDKRGSDFI